MAKKVSIELIDDIDGTRISEGGGRTVQFSFQGHDYEIDLADHNVSALEKPLAPFTPNARTVRGTTGRRRTSLKGSGPPMSRTVRKWAQEYGVTVPPRGRIPFAVIDSYNAAHRS